MIDFIEINSLFNIEKGSLQSTKCTEGGYDFITASSEWKTHNEYTHDQEALIVAVSASGSLGRVHYVNGKFITSDLCFILTPKSKEHPVDLSFYYYIFRSIRDDLVKSTATGTSKLAINKTNFGNYKLPYVDITKQRNFKSKLINVAERKEKLTESNEIQLNLIQTLRQQILQDAITGKLSEKWRKENPDVDPAEILLGKIKAEKEKLTKEGKIRKQKKLPPINENETPFELPDGWMWCRLGEVFQASDYGTSEKAYVSDEGVPVLGMGNIQDLKVILDAPKKLSLKSKDLPRLFLNKYDLLFNRTNSYELVGKSAIFMGNDNQYTFASYLIRLSFNLNYIRPEYISYLINSDWFRKYVVEPQIVQQTGQANFNGTKLGESYVPLPPFNEQAYLVNQVEKLLSQLNRVKEINEDSKKILDILNKSVFKEMFDKNE